MYWLTLFKICFSKYQSNTKRENFNKLYNLEPLNISAYMDPNFPSPLRRVGVVFEWQCNVRTQEVTCILMTVQYEVSRSYLYAFHFFLIFLNSLFWYKRKTFVWFSFLMYRMWHMTVSWWISECFVTVFLLGCWAQLMKL